MATILIVDDEKNIRNTFAAFLTQAGYKAISAPSGIHALELLTEYNFDVVITEIIMPQVSGIQLLEKIHDEKLEIPVIMMTGESNMHTAIEAIKDRAYDYLAKPVSKQNLIVTVNRAVEHKKLLEDKKKLIKENNQYSTMLKETVEAHTELLQAIILTVESIVELRNPYSAGHQRRVGNLAYAIGEKMNVFSHHELEGLRIAGYLHDIGKIMIPQHIFCKDGKLSETEFKTVMNHTIIGYQILKKTKLPWDIASIVLHHHERLDGSGYPYGLKGDEISIETNIIALSDVVEAIANSRPYRPALGIDVALDEIQTHCGTKYHKDVVEACLQLFDEDYELTDDNINFKSKDILLGLYEFVLKGKRYFFSDKVG